MRGKPGLTDRRICGRLRPVNFSSIIIE